MGSSGVAGFGKLALMAGALASSGIAATHPRPRAASADQDSQAPSRLHRETYGLGKWRLRMARDNFSGELRCTIHEAHGRAVYQPGAAGFYFGRDAQVMDAVVRVDNGEALRFRDLLPELARLRVAIAGRDITSPVDGIVWVPLALLDGAREVIIARGFGTRVKRFGVEGLDRLAAYAHEQGCVMGMGARNPA